MNELIDFLPEEFRRKNRGRRFQAWSIVVAGAVGIVVAASVFAQRCQRQEVQRRLAAVTPQYEECLSRQRALEEIHKQLDSQRNVADLYAWVESHWARSGLLAALLRSIPDAVRFEQVQIVSENDRTVVLPRGEKALDEKAVLLLKPHQRDLRKLREEAARSRTVLRITGTTADGAALHRYLGELGGSGLFLKADIESLERIAGSKQESARFRALLVVRPGLGVAREPSAAQQGDVAKNNP